MKKRIATLPFEPWMDSELGMMGHEKAVFAAIWGQAKTGAREIGVGTVCEHTGLSAPTVRKYAGVLADRGYINIEHPHRGVWRYLITENIIQKHKGE